MSKTWNEYSYSILFLHLCAFLEDSIKPTIFTCNFSRILCKMIHIDWFKRENILSIRDEMENYIYSITQSEWKLYVE